MVPRFPLPHFSPLLFVADISTPAFSTPANSASPSPLAATDLGSRCGDAVIIHLPALGSCSDRLGVTSVLYDRRMGKHTGGRVDV